MQHEKVFIFQRLFCIKMWPLLAHKENFRESVPIKTPCALKSLPRRAGELPLNHLVCPDGASAGRMVMLWESKAVSRASLSVWLLTGTISSFPLWPISFHLFLTFIFSPRSLLLAFPNQYFCLKKLNPIKQTSLISPGLPGAKLTSRTQAAVAGLKNK